MICVIEGLQDPNLTEVTKYMVDADVSPSVKKQILSERFWDVVGDFVISAELSEMHDHCIEERICCLVPRYEQKEGAYYSASIIQKLLDKSGGTWRYLFFDDKKMDTALKIPRYKSNDWKKIVQKECTGAIMDKPTRISSLDDYLKKTRPETELAVKGEITPLSAYTKNKGNSIALSPLARGNATHISNATRHDALMFAHPVDQSIIRVLDNPAINSVVNKVVQTSIDANYGLALATGIHVTPSTYNYLYEIVVECADCLNMPVPYVIVSDSVKGINACTAGTDQFAFIAVSSMLSAIMSREQLKFVIGHEMGHLALGHVVYHTAMNLMGIAGSMLPLVGPVIDKTLSLPLNAWSRRSEISADRAGLICCQDVHVAKTALFRLEAGFMDISNIDVDAYVMESEKVLESSTLGKLAEITHKHPIIPKRIKALDDFARSELYSRCLGIPSAPGAMSDASLAREVEKILAIF